MILNVRQAGDYLYWIKAVHLTVTCDVFDSVFLCCSFSPQDVFNWIWDLSGSVSEGFPTYSSTKLCYKYYVLAVV